MNYIEKLAQLNWLEWRMIPTENANEPIQEIKSRLNITSKELDQIAIAVEALVVKWENPNQHKALRTIAKKCWYYLKQQDQEKPIHISFFRHQCLLAKCNASYKRCYPPSEKSIKVICKDGTLEIAKVDFNILKRESPVIGSASSVDKLKITTQVLKQLVTHLSCDELNVSTLSFVEYVDLLAAASLLRIDHLQRRYLSNKGPVLSCQIEQIIDILNSKIEQLKSIDKNIFENELLLDSFQTLIQYLVSLNQSDYLHFIHLIPLKALKLGKVISNFKYACFGPQLPDMNNIPSIETLKLCCWKITKEELIKLSSLKNLRKISFEYCYFSENAIEALSQLIQLESLEIIVPLKQKGGEAIFLSENTFKIIGQLPELRELSFLRGGDIQDEWLQHLSLLKLEKLKINRISKFTGIGFKYLDQNSLKYIKLEVCWDLTKEGVQQIRSFHQLKTLKLGIYPGSNENKKEIDEEAVNILPSLSITKLKLNHRGHISPLALYTKLNPAVEIVDHYVEGSSILNGSKIDVLKRAMQLKKWTVQCENPSPKMIEDALSKISLKDHGTHLLKQGMSTLYDIFNSYSSSSR